MKIFVVIAITLLVIGVIGLVVSRKKTKISTLNLSDKNKE